MHRWIILISLLMLLSVSHVQAQTSPCTPPIENIRFDGEHDPMISLRINELHQADQAIRLSSDEIDYEMMVTEDRTRREEVLGYLQVGQVVTASDLFSAALIFQHGDCPDHYQLAADLAWRSYELGHPNGGWLYGAATDRYLLSIGQPQHYGTQFVPGIDGHFHACPIDPEAVTDEDRRALGLLTVERQRQWIQELEAMYPADLQDIGFIGFLYPIFVHSRCLMI